MHILSADHLRIQTTGTQQNRQLHQDLKPGDLLKVEIIDSLQKQLKLLLADGTTLEAKLDKAIDLYIGQKITLEVKDIIGKQIFMEINLSEQTSKQPNESPGIKNILKQLDLVATPQTEETVKFLMQKMLPVTKENIRQVELGLKTSQLPIETLLSMLENDIPITQSTLTQMKAYEMGEIKLQGQLEAVINDLLLTDNMEQLETVYTILSDAKKQAEVQVTQQNNLQDNIEETSENLEQKDINKEASLKDGASIKNQENKVSAEPKIMSQEIELGASKEVIPRTIDMIKREITDLVKDLFFIRPEQLKEDLDTKLKNTSKLYKDLYEVIDALEKTQEQSNPNREIPIYTDLKSNIEFLNIASKYDTMIHIPLIIQDQYKHGELYIFNQKKHAKSNYQEASMLISLDTVSLGTVGAYIKKYNKQISCQFKTDDKRIEKIIKQNILLLKQNLKSKGYDLTTVTYIPSSQSFTTNKEPASEAYDGRYRFDTKV